MIAPTMPAAMIAPSRERAVSVASTPTGISKGITSS